MLLKEKIIYAFLLQNSVMCYNLVSKLHNYNLDIIPMNSLFFPTL